jgi:FkbM family methyltransferase
MPPGVRRVIRRILNPGGKTPSRSSYLASPLPIEGELRDLFSGEAPLTIFDIGACEGEDSIRYARLFPASRVFAFEPLPRNLAIAERLIGTSGVTNVRLIPCALAESDGEADFHVSSGHPPDVPETSDWDYGNKSSSLLPPDAHTKIHPWVHFDEVIRVPVRTVLSVAHEWDLDRVDFMHIDVQGAELKVLQGAGDLLATVTAIWLEVEAVPLYRDQPLRDEVAEFLSAHGFELRRDTVGKVSGDQLWVGAGAR